MKPLAQEVADDIQATLGAVVHKFTDEEKAAWIAGLECYISRIKDETPPAETSRFFAA